MPSLGALFILVTMRVPRPDLKRRQATEIMGNLEEHLSEYPL